jgi:CRP-like cAMP-binding protein
MEEIIIEFVSRYITPTEEEKKALIGFCAFEHYPKGTIILKEGQYSTDQYLVVKGCLRSYYLLDGEEKTTEFYTGVEPFVPLCSITKQPSEYYVSCEEDTVMMISTPELEQEGFEKFPRFETVCRLLAEEQAAKKQASFDDFKTSSPEERYLNLVNTRADLLQRVPQHQIASFLGITPQSLSRMRKRLLKRA